MAQSELLVFTIDGPSVVGKSVASKMIADVLGPECDVVIEAAGDFFRKATVGVLEKTGWNGSDLEQDDEILTGLQDDKTLDGLVESVLQTVNLYDQRDWGNLSAPVIDDLVSRVGRRTAMQDSAWEWYDHVTELALDQKRDVLIFDGRNPRDRIMNFIESGRVVSALDLMMDCGIQEAALRRIRRGRSSDYVPLDGELQCQAIDVYNRRLADANRTKFPFRMPGYMICVPTILPILPAESADRMVDYSYGLEDDTGHVLPDTLYFDTTSFGLNAMCATVNSLATSAFRAHAQRAKLSCR